MTAVAEGLRDVVIGTSTICEVLPSGQLFYRGYNIHDWQTTPASRKWSICYGMVGSQRSPN